MEAATKVVEEVAEVADHHTRVDRLEVLVDRVQADQEVRVEDPDLHQVADKHLDHIISINL